MSLSLRHWLSFISLLAVALLVVFAWKDIAKAWELLGQVQLWILALVIPAQALSYYASGEVIASFLRAKGELKNVNQAEIAQFSLEFNFVNHILPTAGLSGVSYSTWRFKHLGVSPARATLANALRAFMFFIAYMILLLIAVLALAIDGNINRVVLLFAGSLSTLIVVGTLLFMYIASSASRSEAAGRQLGRFINKMIHRFVHKRQLIKEDRISAFFRDMHVDYVQLRQSPKQLSKPFLWALTFLFLEILLFVIVFASFGEFINPAALLVAYGFAGFVSIFVATPGGAGAYEAVMISFLASAGAPQGVAIAGVVLARVILLLLTIASGYIFYQMAILKYGRKDKPSIK